jgi:hypothetical protein
MMTNATAAIQDPVAAALAIVTTARRGAETTGSHGTAAISLLASGVIFSLIAIAAMLSSPATIPMWCAAHGGCV